MLEEISIITVKCVLYDVLLKMPLDQASWNKYFVTVSGQKINKDAPTNVLTKNSLMLHV